MTIKTRKAHAANKSKAEKKIARTLRIFFDKDLPIAVLSGFFWFFCMAVLYNFYY